MFCNLPAECDLPGLVVWCLSSNFSAITTSNILFLPLFLLLLVFSLPIYDIFCNCPIVLILFCFCHSSFPLLFSLGNFYWHIRRLTKCFLDSVQSTDKPKGILHFCYSFSFFISSIQFWFFPELPSLCLNPSVFAFCLPLTLEPLA